MIAHVYLVAPVEEGGGADIWSLSNFPFDMQAKIMSYASPDDKYQLSQTSKGLSEAVSEAMSYDLKGTVDLTDMRPEDLRFWLRARRSEGLYTPSSTATQSERRAEWSEDEEDAFRALVSVRVRAGATAEAKAAAEAKANGYLGDVVGDIKVLIGHPHRPGFEPRRRRDLSHITRRFPSSRLPRKVQNFDPGLLVKCFNLERVDFSKRNNLSLEAYRQLFEGCPHLRIVDVSGTQDFNDEAVSLLARSCTGVVDVNFSSTLVNTYNALIALRNGGILSNLTGAAFLGCEGLGAGTVDAENPFEMMGTCRNLTRLKLDCRGLRGGVLPLAQCAALEAVTLENLAFWGYTHFPQDVANQLTDDFGQVVRAWKTLFDFRLTGVSYLSSHFLSTLLKHLPVSVTTLHLAHTYIFCRGARIRYEDGQLGRLARLVDDTVKGEFDNCVSSICTRFPNLAVFSCNVGNMNSKDRNRLLREDHVIQLAEARKATLVDLQLWGCAEAVTDGALTALAACRRLRRLWIPDCPNFTDKGLKALVRGPAPTFLGCAQQLEELSIGFNKVVTGTAIRALFLSCPNLKVLDIHGCENVIDSGSFEFVKKWAPNITGKAFQLLIDDYNKNNKKFLGEAE